MTGARHRIEVEAFPRPRSRASGGVSRWMSQLPTDTGIMAAGRGYGLPRPLNLYSPL
jgi:hypothetical protein